MSLTQPKLAGSLQAAASVDVRHRCLPRPGPEVIGSGPATLEVIGCGGRNV